MTPTWRRTAVYRSILKRGRMCETLREPVKVLKSLSEQAINKQYKFKRLYRNLYNPEFYFLAYKNISQSQGSMTPGVDGKSLDGMSEKRINALIESLKDFSYQPNPARRVYIEKKNSTKKRPLGSPSTEDKLVQEVAKMILESIYEPNFSECSHGFAFSPALSRLSIASYNFSTVPYSLISFTADTESIHRNYMVCRR